MDHHVHCNDLPGGLIGRGAAGKWQGEGRDPVDSMQEAHNSSGLKQLSCVLSPLTAIFQLEWVVVVFGRSCGNAQILATWFMALYFVAMVPMAPGLGVCAAPPPQ